MTETERKERRKERQKEWRRNNLDKLKVYRKRYRRVHTEQRAAYLKQWRENNREKLRAQSERANCVQAFGITLKQKVEVQESLWAEQQGKCAICGMPATSYGKPYREDPTGLVLDHDHKSKTALRGLLCHHCNNGLGHFRDSIAHLEAAAAYLRKRKGPSSNR